MERMEGERWEIIFNHISGLFKRGEKIIFNYKYVWFKSGGKIFY